MAKDKLTVLFIGAHPDDMELFCGGTIAKYAEEGHKVTILYSTYGQKGHVTIPSDKIAKIREREAVDACKILGAEPMFLGLVDQEIYYTPENEMKYVKAIRQVRPDIIVTLFPYDYGIDHTIVQELVFGALHKTTLPLHKPELGPELEKTPRLYYCEPYAAEVNRIVPFIPDYYVDITRTFNKKIEALRCHKSQLELMGDYFKTDLIQWAEGMARSRGFQCGVKYAEAFKRGWGRGMGTLMPAVHLLP